MSYLDWIYTCNNYQASAYVPWFVEGQVYGYLSQALAEKLLAWPEVFSLSQPQQSVQQLSLNPALKTYHERSEALAPILHDWHQQGLIDTWVNEAYPVTLGFAQPPIAEIERAGASYLGVKTFGVHVNGLVQKADGVYVWVGTRTLTKPFWPGKLDQMVAGGQPVGLGLMANVIKESAEEAGIPSPIAQQAQAVSQVSYRQSGRRGLDHSTIFIYDLWLPEDFVPVNTDGEVIQFELLPLAEVARLTDTTTAFKDNCNLVNIDLLLRQGWINHQHPDYAALLNNFKGKEYA